MAAPASSYHVNRNGARCKHILAVEMLLASQANVQDAGEPMTLDRPDVRCPNCKSVKFCKNGNRYHKHRDPTQTFKCLKCNRRFTGKPGFEHRRHDPSMIIFCLMAFGFGISPNNISLMFANCGNRVHQASCALGHALRVWWSDTQPHCVRQQATGGVPMKSTRGCQVKSAH